jgi:hypothetical protein
MNAITYFNAYKKTRDKMSFYQAQQGGDYSDRKKKAQRQAAKFEQALITQLAAPEPTKREMENALYMEPMQAEIGSAAWWDGIQERPFDA